MVTTDPPDDPNSNNISLVHKPHAVAYLKQSRAAAAGDPVSKRARHVKFATPDATKHKVYPEITNTDIQKMARLFDIDYNPLSEANVNQYFDRGGGILDGSDQQAGIISGAAFVKTVGARMTSQLSNYVANKEEHVYIQNLFDNFPKLLRPANGHPLVWLRYFIEWISALNNVPDITMSLNSPREVVVQTGNLDANSVLEPMDTMRDSLDADEQFGSQVLGITVHDVYPTYKRWLSLHTILLLKEILTPSNDVLMDRMLRSVQKIVGTMNASRIVPSEQIAVLNQYIHNFDFMDQDDTMQFSAELTETARAHNIVLPAPFATTSRMLFVHNRENMYRLQMAKMVLGIQLICPRDFYNLFITSEARVLTISLMIRSHAMTSTLALVMLQNLTRVFVDCKMDQYDIYTNLDTFQKVLDVVRTGIYPCGLPLTMSAKKRYTCLMLCACYVELQFDAFLKYARIDAERNPFLYHAIFWRVPNLFHSLCREIKRGNLDLALVPMHLLFDLDAQVGTPNDRFQQYVFCNYGDDYAMLPRVAEPMKLIAIYVDIMSEHKLINIDDGDEIIRKYYETLLTYCVTAVQLPFQPVIWTPVFISILQSSSGVQIPGTMRVLGTVGENERRIEPVTAKHIDVTLGHELHRSMVPIPYMAEQEVRAFQDPNTPPEVRKELGVYNVQYKVDTGSSFGATRNTVAAERAARVAAGLNAVDQDLVPDVEREVLSTYSFMPTVTRMSVLEQFRAPRPGAPGGLDLEHDGSLYPTQLEQMLSRLSTVGCASKDGKGSRPGSDANTELLHLAKHMHEAVVAEQKGIATRDPTIGEMNDRRERVVALSAFLANRVPYYGVADSHQINTIESLFRLIYSHRHDLVTVRWGIVIGVHPITQLNMASLRELQPPGTAYPPSIGFLRPDIELPFAYVMCDVAQSMMAMFQIEFATLHRMMSMLSYTPLEILVSIFDFSISQAEVLRQMHRRMVNERTTDDVVSDDMVKANAWKDTPRPLLFSRWLQFLEEQARVPDDAMGNPRVYHDTETCRYLCRELPNAYFDMLKRQITAARARVNDLSKTSERERYFAVIHFLYQTRFLEQDDENMTRATQVWDAYSRLAHDDSDESRTRVRDFEGFVPHTEGMTKTLLLASGYTLQRSINTLTLRRPPSLKVNDSNIPQTKMPYTLVNLVASESVILINLTLFYDVLRENLEHERAIREAPVTSGNLYRVVEAPTTTEKVVFKLPTTNRRGYLTVYEDEDDYSLVRNTAVELDNVVKVARNALIKLERELQTRRKAITCPMKLASIDDKLMGIAECKRDLARYITVVGSNSADVVSGCTGGPFGSFRITGRLQKLLSTNFDIENCLAMAKDSMDLDLFIEMMDFRVEGTDNDLMPPLNRPDLIREVRRGVDGQPLQPPSSESGGSATLGPSGVPSSSVAGDNDTDSDEDMAE